MSLIQRDDLIEQLAPAAADPALRDSILPRALDGGLHAAQLHGLNRSRDFQSILCVVNQNEELARGLIGKCFAQLLDNPTAGRIVVRKNSIRARKTMEMLSFTSLVSSLPDCRNPGASCDPITLFLVRSAFLRTWVCAMLDHVSSCPLGFTLARLLRPSRWSLDPGRTSFPRSNPPSAERGECGDPVPPEAVGLLPRAPSPSATAYRLRPILPGLLVTAV